MAVKVITREEALARSKRGGINEEYVAQMKKAGVGGLVGIDVPEEGVSRQTVKNRVKKTAEALGYTVKFWRSGEDDVVFEITGDDSTQE